MRGLKRKWTRNKEENREELEKMSVKKKWTRDDKKRWTRWAEKRREIKKY